MLGPIHGNHAKRVSEFVTNRHVIGSLNNLERIGHIRRTRHARQKTVRFGGVGGPPFCAVLLLFRQRLGLVRDFTAFHRRAVVVLFFPPPPPPPARARPPPPPSSATSPGALFNHFNNFFMVW